MQVQVQAQAPGQDNWDTLSEYDGWDIDEPDIAHLSQVNQEGNQESNNNRPFIFDDGEVEIVSNNPVPVIQVPNNHIVTVRPIQFDDEDIVNINTNSYTKSYTRSVNLIYIISTFIGILAIIAIIFKFIRFLSELNIYFLIFCSYVFISFGFRKTSELVGNIFDDMINDVVEIISPKNIFKKTVSGFFTIE